MGDVREQLDAFLIQVTRELGVRVSPREGGNPPPEIPDVLASFYCETDGLELPFLDIWPLSKIRDGDVPGWLMFGADHYFSYCLCDTKKGTKPPLDLWDHESGNEPEGFYATVLDLIRGAYEDQFREALDWPCSLVVTDLPKDVRLAQVVADLKKLAGGSSAELLGGLRKLPFVVESKNPHAAIRVVRQLQSKRILCHLEGL